MKKFLGILVLMSILFTSIFAVNSFADENVIVIDTPAFSLELPEGFKESFREEERGFYYKGGIELYYEFTTKAEGSSYYEDVEECMRDSHYNYKYSNLDFGYTTQLIEIGGKNFLKDVVNRKGLKQVMYLTTTAENITYIEFFGSEDMDEDEVEKIISNIEIKGTTAKSYKNKMNILIYGGIAIIFIILPITFRTISKRKKMKKIENEVDDTMFIN